MRMKTIGVICVFTAVAAVLIPAGSAGLPELAPATTGPSLSVASLNLARQPNDAVMRELESKTVAGADVLLLQELLHRDGETEKLEERIARRFGGHAAFAPEFELFPGAIEGLAIVSRFPIGDVEIMPLARYDCHFHTRHRIALGVTLDTPSGRVRIYNVHLDTRINAADRVAQVKPVVKSAARFNGPSLIGGDFNTNHFYWIGRVAPLPYAQPQGRAVDRLMQAHGFSTPFRRTGPTFDHLNLQLDWLYVNRMKAVQASIEPIEFSDHHAIMARFAQ
jgi:endonuclease/exonuclease/phosphatase family metal-dependent hydrolase